MSLKVGSISQVPEDTARVAKAVFRKGNRYLLLRDTFGDLFSGDDFQALFHAEGRPAVDPARLALITILQFAEKLSNERMADAVRSRIDLKRPQSCAGVGLRMPACPHCSNARTHKDGRDRAGKQRYRCSACQRSFTDRSSTPFTNHRWPRDVIVMAVRWYFSYRLSAANVRNLLAERGLDVSRQTVADWVQKFGVLLAEVARRYAKPLGSRWFVDETYVRVGKR